MTPNTQNNPPPCSAAPLLISATINGRYHRTMQRNGQDFATAASPAPGIAFGIVLDGCGSSHRDALGSHASRNEVGAALLGNFVAAYLHNKLAAPNFCLDLVLAGLAETAVAFLHHTLTAIPFPDKTSQTRFIATHLLATLVGFVVTPETAVCFWAGDGFIRINDTILPLDSNNHPDYLAYSLLAPATKDCPPTRPLAQLTIRHRPALHTLAIASDGWTPDLLASLQPPQSSLHLQRWLNTHARQRPHFDDDGAIALWQNG